MSTEDPNYSERLASIETGLTSLVGSVNQLVQTTEKRFQRVEATVNQPFPMFQFASVLFAGFAMMGTLFSFAVNPLFTETERNRTAQVNSTENAAVRQASIASVKGELRGHNSELDNLRDWLKIVSERERRSTEKVTALESKVVEYQREALTDQARDFERLENEISRNSRIEQSVARNSEAIDNMKTDIKDIDHGGSRKWNSRNNPQ